MRVCVIGAGLAGLAAARTLRAAGVEAVVYEKGEHVGGRVATDRLGPFVFDTGATTLAPNSKALAKAMLEELPTEELVRIELPIYVHEALRASVGDPRKNAVPRYTYLRGNSTLTDLLAEGLEVRFGTEVTSFSKSEDRSVEVAGERFDAVVVAIPAPDALQLLQASGEWRPLGSVYYRPCLSLMLGYDLQHPQVKYHALIDPEQRHPLTWLSIESLKCASRAPEGCTAMVVQMSPMFSGSHFGDEDAKVLELALDYIERLYGKEWALPKVSGVVRWKYSQPEAIASFDMVNRVGSNIVLAGDGLIGSRTEHAYESGVRAAEMVVGSGETGKR